MARRFVDLSIAVEMGVPSDPPGMEPVIEYTRHKDSVAVMAAYFPGLTPADMPDGEGWASERVHLSTHNGTHMDAPYHFHSTTDHGRTRALVRSGLTTIRLNRHYMPRGLHER